MILEQINLMLVPLKGITEKGYKQFFAELADNINNLKPKGLDPYYRVLLDPTTWYELYKLRNDEDGDWVPSSELHFLGDFMRYKEFVFSLTNPVPDEDRPLDERSIVLQLFVGIDGKLLNSPF